MEVVGISIVEAADILEKFDKSDDPDYLHSDKVVKLCSIPSAGYYVVQTDNDTFESIAKYMYNDERMAPIIMMYNGVTSLKPGDRIDVPDKKLVNLLIQ